MMRVVEVICPTYYILSFSRTVFTEHMSATLLILPRILQQRTAVSHAPDNTTLLLFSIFRLNEKIDTSEQPLAIELNHCANRTPIWSAYTSCFLYFFNVHPKITNHSFARCPKNPTIVNYTDTPALLTLAQEEIVTATSSRQRLFTASSMFFPRLPIGFLSTLSALNNYW